MQKGTNDLDSRITRLELIIDGIKEFPLVLQQIEESITKIEKTICLLFCRIDGHIDESVQIRVEMERLKQLSKDFSDLFSRKPSDD